MKTHRISVDSNFGFFFCVFFYLSRGNRFACVRGATERAEGKRGKVRRGARPWNVSDTTIMDIIVIAVHSVRSYLNLLPVFCCGRQCQGSFSSTESQARNTLCGCDSFATRNCPQLYDVWHTASINKSSIYLLSGMN